MRETPEGTFAVGDGIEITAEEGGLVLTCELTALVAEDDSITAIGVCLDLEENDEMLSTVLLDAEECEALAELLQRAAAQLRDGDFEAAVREGIEAERDAAD